jgi:diguanylate cyclase (GGDEF)-like protein
MMVASSDQIGIARGIATQADHALAVVRVVLGVLACFVLGGYRPLVARSSLWLLIGELTMIMLSVVLLNWVGKRVPRAPSWGWFSQALDVAAAVGLVVLLDDPLEQQSWVLLVVPVVSGAVRHGTAASVASWVVGCLGYLAAATTSLIESSGSLTVLARVRGTLLAVAITVGLLARWMREGWELQSDLTAAVTVRENRLAVIERTAHALKNLAPRDALELCVTQAASLGFAAVTVHPEKGGDALFAVGDGEIVAVVPKEEQPEPRHPTVTVWVEKDEVRSHSVSVHEPQTRCMVTGWSEQPIESDQAQALATLVAHASSAIEASKLLGQLRWTASRDALTGLVNRRTLDARLDELAAKPGRLAVAFVDADDFKTINDQYGHDVGDKALVAIARRLEAATGNGGIVGRHGGDEFVILMPNASMVDAQRIAQAMLDACLEPIAVEAWSFAVKVSVGIATADTPVDGAAILRAADAAVYEAKAAGKTTVIARELQSAQ